MAVSCSSPYLSSSREAGARSLCVRVTQCIARGGRQRDYATTRHQRSTRSGEAPKGKGGMHEGASVRSGLHGDKSGDRGTRKRGGIFQVSSAMRHRWGRAVTRVLTCVGVHVRPCGASTHGDCTGRRRDQAPTEILHFSFADHLGALLFDA